MEGGLDLIRSSDGVGEGDVTDASWPRHCTCQLDNRRH